MEFALLLMPEWFDILLTHVSAGSAAFAALQGAISVYGLLKVRCNETQAASLLAVASSFCPPAAAAIRDALNRRGE
jgi:hypothetical protein